MSPEVSRPMFGDYIFPFAPLHDFLIVDNACLLTLDNNACDCSVGENTILDET